MKKLLFSAARSGVRQPLAVYVATLLACVSPASAMSYFTPANVTTACALTSAAEQIVLADEQLANQVAGHQVVRTGTTSTIANVTPSLCAQIGGVAGTLQASRAFERVDGTVCSRAVRGRGRPLSI